MSTESTWGWTAGPYDDAFSDIVLGDDMTLRLVGPGGVVMAGPVLVRGAYKFKPGPPPGTVASHITHELAAIGSIGDPQPFPAHPTESREVFEVLRLRRYSVDGAGRSAAMVAAEEDIDALDLLRQLELLRQAVINLNARLKAAGML